MKKSQVERGRAARLNGLVMATERDAAIGYHFLVVAPSPQRIEEGGGVKEYRLLLVALAETDT